MAEAKTADRERAEQSIERAFSRAEDMMSAIGENNRRMVQAAVAFNRYAMQSTMRLAYDIQNESLRVTDAWLDQVLKFQRNNLSLIQDYSKNFQEHAQKAVETSQTQMEESMTKTMEMVAPAGRRR